MDRQYYQGLLEEIKQRLILKESVVYFVMSSCMQFEMLVIGTTLVKGVTLTILPPCAPQYNRNSMLH